MLSRSVGAGNRPVRRMERRGAFCELICREPWGPLTRPMLRGGSVELPDGLRMVVDSVEAARAMLEGQNGFFVPRPWYTHALASQGPHTASFYDTRPLRTTLGRFVDFDRINSTGEMRVSVGAGNGRDGNFAYFDNAQRKLRPEHFMASRALPPAL